MLHLELSQQTIFLTPFLIGSIKYLKKILSPNQQVVLTGLTQNISEVR